MAKVRSAKGEVVDFDLLKIKNKLQSKDKTSDVQMRERYIEVKRRRNPKRSVSDLVAEQQANEAAFREKMEKSKSGGKGKPKSTPEPTATEAQRKSRSRIVKSKKAEEAETPDVNAEPEPHEDDNQETEE